MEYLQDRDTSQVAASLRDPVQVTRHVGAWGLADHGYEVTEMYPDPASMGAAERPLSFAVALGAELVHSAVQVMPTEQG